MTPKGVEKIKAREGAEAWQDRLSRPEDRAPLESDPSAQAIPFPASSLYLWKSVALMASLAIALLGWKPAARVSLPLLLVSHLAIDLVICALYIPTAKFLPAENWDLKFLNGARADGEAKRPMFRVDFASSNITTNAVIAAKVENLNGYWPFAIGRYFP